MQNFIKNKPEKSSLNKNFREDYAVTILLAWMTTMLMTFIASILILKEDSHLEKISKHFNLFAIALQIFPILLSFIVTKIDSLRNFWIFAYWATLFLELIAITAVMFVISA